MHTSNHNAMSLPPSPLPTKHVDDCCAYYQVMRPARIQNKTVKIIPKLVNQIVGISKLCHHN